MTTNAIAAQHADAIKQLREAARNPLEDSSEWRDLRRRRMTDERQSRRRFWEELARSTGVDLAALENTARGDRDQVNQDAMKTLEALEAQAMKDAQASKRALERRRARDLSGDHFPIQPGGTAVVFRSPFSWSGIAQPSECYTGLAGGGLELPVYKASAELSINEGGAGLWLFPYLLNKNGDCSSHENGFTLHELIFHLPPPAATVQVNGIDVNLHGHGVGSSIEGATDSWWWDSLAVFTAGGAEASVTLDVWMGQYVHDEWQFWPLLSDQIFVRYGGYVSKVQFILSSRNYPANFKVRSPAGGGADLLCYLTIRCKADATGNSGSRARLTFQAPDFSLGIFVGGVTLVGQVDQSVLEL